MLFRSAAAGGVIGSLISERIIKRFGEESCLVFVQIGMAVGTVLVGLASSWPIVWLLTMVETIMAIVWNTITVTFRQSVIPTNLIGRVNSVYRFFGWGFMPLGALTGGAIVSIAEQLTTRDFALRLPYFVAGAIGLLIYLLSRSQINGDAFNKARDAAKLD